MFSEESVYSNLSVQRRKQTYRLSTLVDEIAECLYETLDASIHFWEGVFQSQSITLSLCTQLLSKLYDAVNNRVLRVLLPKRDL